MVTATEKPVIQEDSPKIMESSGLYYDLYKEYDVIDRVAHLPVVSSTLSAVHDYYTKMKKAYPAFSPYFQAAENITYSAAILALRSSKPVVDKFGPTLNAYANTGLDKLEGSIPLIKKHPSEVIEETKYSASNMINNKVDRALSITEEYVDYYLPSEEEYSKSDENLENSSMDESDEEARSNAKQRLGTISHKVKRRSYEKAMQSWSGIRTRSEEALNKFNFTVDLIQYAKAYLSTSKKSLNEEKLPKLQMKDLESDDDDDDAMNQQLCPGPIIQPRDEDTCRSSNKMQSRFSDQLFSDKTYSMILATAKGQIQLIEDILVHVLNNIALVPPVAWVTLNFDEDPLDGIGMHDLELQLNDRPVVGVDAAIVEGGPLRRERHSHRG